MKKIAAAIMFALFGLVTSAHAVPITGAEVYIYNVEGATDYPFAIIDGASHHALLWDTVNGYRIENATYDWIPLGDYLCLAGQRCVVSGEGIRFVDFWFNTLTTPTIDFWGRPLATSVPEPDTLPLMIAGLVTVYLLAFVVVLKGKRT